jgi:peptidoglycan/LPS O-acetylase OafA/YrhL
VLGLLGWLVNRYLAAGVALAIILVNALTWTGHATPWTWTAPGPSWFSDWLTPTMSSFFLDPYNTMLLAPFAFGMLFAFWGRLIPVHWLLAYAGLALACYTYAEGNWNAWGQYGLLYFMMWGAISWTRLQNWERFGDFSYGVYIFAWPLMTFACFFGLQHAGMAVYLLVVSVAAHVIAFGSWHLIEKPAMSLKDWSPKAALAQLRARTGRGGLRAGSTATAAALDPAPALNPAPVMAGTVAGVASTSPTPQEGIA